MRTPLFALLLLTGVAGADEKRLTEAEVPKAVVDGVAHRYPTARRVGFERETEKGQTVYEAHLLVDGRKLEVDVSPAGQVLVEEEEIPLASVPAAVRKALSAAEKVKRAEKVTHTDRPDAPEYELLLTGTQGLTEVVYAADGKQLRVEKKKKDD